MTRSTQPVDIIIPIYRGYDETLTCIKSVIDTLPLNQTPTQVIVINDASPDTELVAAVKALIKHPAFTLIENQENLGFVKSVNLGMQQSNHDVILLNSDTEVANNWIDRLQNAAYEDAKCATVTPLSNNTTICTFPEFLQDNPLPFGYSVAEVDQVFAQFDDACIETPTGIGFCLYIKRLALDKVGYFDEKSFGRGYGEEIDFCQRAIRFGMTNFICPNIFVYHLGGVSFADEKKALIKEASEIIDKKHPNYHSDTNTFVATNPFYHVRLKRLIKLIRISKLPKTLHVSHGMGGGVEQHIDELIHATRSKSISLKIAPTDDNGNIRLTLTHGLCPDPIFFKLPNEINALKGLLTYLDVSFIHFHHILRVPQTIIDLPNSLAIPYLVTIHDYYLINGNPTLTDEHGVYPGYIDINALSTTYPLPDSMTLDTFKARSQRFINNAKAVIFPSRSTQTLFTQIYKCPHGVTAWHLETNRNTSQPVKALVDKNHYTIGLFGAINREKGADVLEAVAKWAKDNRKPWTFVLIGYAYRPLNHIKQTGPYDPEELYPLIEENQLDICFFPAQCPETYSYALSHALNIGLPIFASNIGALTERLINRPVTQLFNHLDSTDIIGNTLAQFIEQNKQVNGSSFIHQSNREAESEDLTQFYPNKYLDLITKSTENKKQPDLSKSINFDPSWITQEVPKMATATRKEKIAVFLWKCSTHPLLGWLNRIIPFRVKRKIKHILSNKSVHDLVNQRK